ncbi:MAG: hypothetical protein FJ096_13025 [Deltaproteobacteria bacterium]|nr:hypothetical protein [Deltaproteobacteria bacterium]
MTTPAAPPSPPFAPTESGTPLLCLNERPAPETLASDLEALLGLSPQAKARFRDVLLPCLAPALDATIDKEVE